MNDKIEELYKEWQSLQPISDEARQRLHRKFVLEFNYNSNHIEGNTLTYGQTEILLLFGRVVDSAKMKDLEDMKASNVGLNMMQEQAVSEYPLTETFIRQLHKTIMREDYVEYRSLPDGRSWHYTVHAGIYKTRPNSVVTPSGERFEYASPEETPALMTDLVSWYREEEERSVMTPIELASLFHFRYIRIHPFEDGNGRIARLLVNFILARHHYPMVVVKSADKNAYLDALNKCDYTTGPIPADGAHASLEQITPFVEYMTGCLERSLKTCISAAKGEVIAEEDDFAKELRILERNMGQKEASQNASPHKTVKEVWNVLRFVFAPIAEQLENVVNTTTIFFNRAESRWLISPTTNIQDATELPKVADVDEANEGYALLDKTVSIWYQGELTDPKKRLLDGVSIDKHFYIAFFDDHYFVDGILNKNFPYGTYPSEKEKDDIISQFKDDILNALKGRL